MPYNILGLLISLAMLGAFLLVGDVSIRAKVLVAALFAVSVLLQAHSPTWKLAGFLTQMALAIGLAFHFKGRR